MTRFKHKITVLPGNIPLLTEDDFEDYGCVQVAPGIPTAAYQAEESSIKTLFESEERKEGDAEPERYTPNETVFEYFED